MMALTATALPAKQLDPETDGPASQGLRRDLDLVQRHRYGDAAAFDEIYRTYEEMVFNLALGLSADPDRAADLTQETFLRIHRHLGKFKGVSSLKTWIYRVALNHCRSRLKRRRPDPLPLNDDREGPGAFLPAPGRSPEQQAMATSDARHLRRALAALPGRFRDAVVLRDLQELSYDEIAAVLGVRIGTVRSRIARGRLRLHKELVAMEARRGANRAMSRQVLGA